MDNRMYVPHRLTVEIFKSLKKFKTITQITTHHWSLWENTRGSIPSMRTPYPSVRDGIKLKRAMFEKHLTKF